MDMDWEWWWKHRPKILNLDPSWCWVVRLHVPVDAEKAPEPAKSLTEEKILSLQPGMAQPAA